jgi:peptidoglycan/xylan/chitin deacetylase (PgdA/CDA1 family)
VEAIDLEWTPLKEAQAYRLTITDSETGERLVRTDPLSAPRYALDPLLAEDREIEAILEFRPEDAADDAWQKAGPTAHVPVLDPRSDATILRWNGVSPVHRLVIADQTAARTVFNRPVLGSTYPYLPSPTERGHDLVMRVHAWRDGDWDEGTKWQPLPLRVLLGDRRDPPPPLDSEVDSPVLLAFTIDTEGFLARQRDPNPATAVDELVFGDYGNFEDYGIGLHMDLLEHFGFRGTFFVDVLSEYQYGREALQRTVDAIMSRGHEVQLHVHDEHLRNSDDPKVRALAGDLSNMDSDAFRRIFELAVRTFERLTGTPPLAYRAGGYRITDDHFPVLEEFGIKVDSSVQAFFHARISDWMRTRTQPYWIGDLLEVPPTWTLVLDQRTAPETRAFAPNRTAGDPVSRMPASSAGVPRVATYVSHSCELMRVERNPTAEAVDEYERRIRARVRPEVADRVVQEVRTNARLIDGRLDEDLRFRVAGLLRRIADREDARCVTFSQLAEMAGSFPRERRAEPVDPVPVIDRPRGFAGVTGTRVYSRELLAHLSSSPGAPIQFGEDPLSALVNAEVSWEGSEIAVVGDEFDGLSGWLERRGVGRVERFESPTAAASPAFDVVIWLSGFEQCPPEELHGRLEAARAMIRADGALVLRIRTLGVAPASVRNGEPPLAELLFPADFVGSPAVTAWDAATFSAWLTDEGFRVEGERWVPRNGLELTALDRFTDKLGALDGDELRTGAVDYTLRQAEEEVDPAPASARVASADTGADLVERFDAIAPGDAVLVISSGGDAGSGQMEAVHGTITTATPEELGAGRLEERSADVIVCSAALAEVELERLESACGALYRALRPGGQLLLAIGPKGAGLASPTTILVGLLRSGLEVLVAERSSGRLDCRLLRPLELTDLAAFAGVKR